MLLPFCFFFCRTTTKKITDVIFYNFFKLLGQILWHSGLSYLLGHLPYDSSSGYSQSSFQLTHLVGSRWWFQYLGPCSCHPSEKPALGFELVQMYLLCPSGEWDLLLLCLSNECIWGWPAVFQLLSDVSDIHPIIFCSLLSSFYINSPNIFFGSCKMWPLKSFQVLDAKQVWKVVAF